MMASALASPRSAIRVRVATSSSTLRPDPGLVELDPDGVARLGVKAELGARLATGGPAAAGLDNETLLDQAADGRGDCRAREPGAPDELDPADRTSGPDGVKDRCPPASRGGQLCAHGALRPLDRVSVGRDLVTESRETYRIVDELSSTN